MNRTSEINEYIHSLTSSPHFKGQVVYHTALPATPSWLAQPEAPWPEDVKNILNALGIQELYGHQAEAVDHIRSGHHVVVATSTASGKTLTYNLPVIEKILEEPGTKALYIFPLKALAQDQLRVFNEMTGCIKGAKPNAAIYDGDTSAWHRKRIRENPPNVVLTNPEMIHLSFLPYHQKWEAFLSGLKMVVVDEVHTYRGILGSHMAQVFRRFRRVCDYYRVDPVFVFSSATIANPDQLAGQLTGVNVKTITKSDAPRGKRHVVFIDPLNGSVQTAILLLKAALHRGLRTIIYTQSRKLTELIALWAGSKSGPYAKRISAYRSGFLPEERRDIEKKLSSGELLAVISTSALELGIDIGDLDLCILVGYPGSVMATWQRSGRVGRSGQDAALILIAGEDALDQYFLRYPEALIKMEHEAAVVNPYNPDVLLRHLLCAAAELPLKTDEPLLADTRIEKVVYSLEQEGELLRSEDGKKIYSKRTSPHRQVDLRGTGSRFNIVCSRAGQSRGEIDGFRAFRETHPGAIYIHQGDTYLVDELDPDTKTVKVSEARVDYYTKVRGFKETEILETFNEKSVWNTSVFEGRVKVTDQVTGYERWSIRNRKLLNIVSLDLPPQVFETEGLWFRIPAGIQGETEGQHFHFVGGIHAIEHAAIGVFPLLVLADRNDLGGIATPFHPAAGSAVVFIYDGIPGGAGLSRQAFRNAKVLLENTLHIIRTCPCESGCPACVHSPKCGSGNRPIDKSAALFILTRLRDSSSRDIFQNKITEKNARQSEPLTDDSPGEFRVREKAQGSGRVLPSLHSLRFRQRIRKKRGIKRNLQEIEKASIEKPVKPVQPGEALYYGVFDIETQRSAAEVGGWHRADRMGLSCAVLYDSKKNTFFEFLEDQVPLLLEHLRRLDLVVGFNIKRFDYHVLSGYTDFNFQKLPTLDILEEIKNRLGYRLSLNHLAKITLGVEKSADGLQALEWWKQGRLRDLVDYCRKDVSITKDLFLYGKKMGYLLFKNKAGKNVRIPLDW